MAFTGLSHLFSTVSILLMLLCILAPLVNKIPSGTDSFLKKLVSYHSIYGILLIAAACFHGVLAERSSAAKSGAVVWVFLVLLGISALLGKRMPKAVWKKIHISLSILVCVLVFAHVSLAVTS